MSQITTHVLDTALGKPGAGIHIQLQGSTAGKWETKGKGITNADGRVASLLPEGAILPPAIYRMVFATGGYFAKQKKATFYPTVVVYFEISDESHYHVPLLLSPFGYSTYRGS